MAEIGFTQDVRLLGKAPEDARKNSFTTNRSPHARGETACFRRGGGWEGAGGSGGGWSTMTGRADGPSEEVEHS